MLQALDHVRIGVSDPAQAAADYAALLRLPGPAKSDASGAIRVELDGVGLVLVECPKQSVGVQGLAFAGSLPDRDGGDGGKVPSLAETRGIPIELIEGASRAPQASREPAVDGAERLDHAVVLTSDHEAALRLYGERLGLRLALDQSFPERGVRLLFFRVGGVTIEIGGPLEPPASPSARDGFGGLAWRGPDVVAWRERLLEEGFDVSQHRPGHKAGTRVCTVRSRTGGVPTLLISPEA